VHVELVAIAQTVEFIVERAGRNEVGACEVAEERNKAMKNAKRER
jgi:hypothetical protein